MAKILSVASSEVLQITRQLLLEKEGYSVLSLQNHSVVQELENLNDDSYKPDLALVGHTFSGTEKRKIALAINRHFPGLPILEMCYQSPEIPGADFLLSDSPDHLLVAIRDVLSGRRVRGFVH